MDWLTPAMSLMAVASAVLALSFLYVWQKFIRQRFVLLWALSWLVSVPAVALGLFPAADRSSLHWSLCQVLTVLHAALMVAGCVEFTHGRPHAGRLAAATGLFGVWALVAPRLTDRFLWLHLPGAVLLACSYLWASLGFARLHQKRQVRGARIVATLFFVLGLHELDYPLLGSHSSAAPFGYALAAALALAIALFLLVTILEESRASADRERARVRAILDNLPVGVVVTAPDGTVNLSNDETVRLAGGAPADGAARVLAESLRASDGSPLPDQDPIAQVLATGERTQAQEFSLATAPDAVRAVLVNAGPVLDQAGELLGAVAVFQDVDELRKMQNAVDRSRRLQALGTLAAGVAHDINNILGVILAYAELAQLTASDAKTRSSLDIIVTAATDGADTVRRIQTSSANRLDDDEVVDVAEVVNGVVVMCRPRWNEQARANGVSYQVECQLDAGLLINGRAAELREAVLNLVLNSLDAMPDGGTLRLSAGGDDDEVVLQVADDGSGMTPAVKEQAFEPYFTTKGTHGTGLGLAVVLGIVQRHGGRVHIDSAVGSGTTFHVHLPRIRRAPTRSLSARPRPVSGRRVLVVDDNPDICASLQQLLQAHGFAVATAACGADAVSLLERVPYDLLVTDLRMPDMTGCDLVRRARRLHPAIATIVMTGWSDLVDPPVLEAAGVDRLLSKPFTMPQLLDAIAEAASARPPEASPAAALAGA